VADCSGEAVAIGAVKREHFLELGEQAQGGLGIVAVHFELSHQLALACDVALAFRNVALGLLKVHAQHDRTVHF
jgi:hypothetical protein